MLKSPARGESNGGAHTAAVQSVGIDFDAQRLGVDLLGVGAGFGRE